MNYDRSMNYDHSISWRISYIPSENTVINQEHYHVNLYEMIPTFYLTLPLCARVPLELSDTVERVFPGGTFMSLLQMIHDFYQEPVSPEELVRLTNLSEFNRNLMITLAERQGPGAIIRRIDVLGGSATFVGIRDDLLLVNV